MNNSDQLPAIEGDFLRCSENVEHRDAPREVVSIPMVGVVVSALDSTEFDIVCTDIARQGMAFLSPIALAQHEKVAVKMPIRNGMGRLVLCRVCHCRPKGNQRWLVGVVFVEAVSMRRADECAIPPRWLQRK